MTFPPTGFFVQAKPLKVFSIVLGFLIAGCHSQTLQTKPTIEIKRVPAASAGGPDRMESIGGQVKGAKPGQQIVIYAKNDIWWVQPFWSRPLTPIQSDSSWNTTTHLGTDYAALLVDPGYRPQKKIAALPVEGNGVVAVVAAKGTPTTATDLKVIHFSGYDWTVRSGANDRGGEVNVYDPANAWTDQKGYLHLHMGESNGRWSSAEVSLTHSLGYGTYRFCLLYTSPSPRDGLLSRMPSSA